MGVDFTIAQLLFPWCQESQNKKCPAWTMDDVIVKYGCQVGMIPGNVSFAKG